MGEQADEATDDDPTHDPAGGPADERADEDGAAVDPAGGLAGEQAVEDDPTGDPAHGPAGERADEGDLARGPVEERAGEGDPADDRVFGPADGRAVEGDLADGLARGLVGGRAEEGDVADGSALGLVGGRAVEGDLAGGPALGPGDDRAGEGGAGGGPGPGGEELVERLIAAARGRVVCDLGGPGGLTPLAADVVRGLCTERRGEVDRFGLRIRGASITGVLDLRAVDVPFALEFAGCDLAEAPIVEGADLHSLAFVAGTRLPGLLANGVRIRRDLDLSGAEVWGASKTPASTSQTAAIWLSEADIGGRLLAVGTRIVGPADRSIQADRTHVGGNIRLLHGFVADGELRFLAVRLDGSFDLSGARLVPKNGRALDLAEASVGGSIFLVDDESTPGSHGPEVHGRIELGHATVGGRIFVRNSTLVAPPPGEGAHRYFDRAGEPMQRKAVNAPRLTVVGDVELAATRVEGGLNLTAAEVKGAVVLDGITIRNPGDRAIDLTTAAVGGDVSGVELRAQGAVHLTGARVGGAVRLSRAYLSRPPEPLTPGGWRPPLLVGDGLEVARDLVLRGMVTRAGAVRFHAARVGDAVDLVGAHLLHSRGYTVSFQQAVIGGSVFMHGDFRSRGLVAFNRATIEGRLVMDGSTLVWPRRQQHFNGHDAAFWGIGMTVRGGMVLGWRRVVGGVDLSDATTSHLADDPARWGDRVALTGFTYTRFAALPGSPPGSNGSWDVDDRVRWLAGQDSPDPGPFEQAAAVYRAHGRATDAEDVLIRGRRLLRQRRASQSLRHQVARVGDWLLDRLVGYGYRPGRAIGLLALLLAVTAGALALPAAATAMRATDPTGEVFTPDGPLDGAPEEDLCGDGKVRCYQPVLLAVDTVVPIIDLGQRSTWYPSHHDGAGWLYEWGLNLATIVGWILSTVFALSFTRLARPS